MTDFFKCSSLLGDEVVSKMARARRFLQSRAPHELLPQVGRTLKRYALTSSRPDKRTFPVAYGGGKPCGDDLLAGHGMFYITEAGKLMLDCTSGHYQMTWGYNHPELCALAAEAAKLGIVWDNHSNIPSMPVKILAEKLVALAGGNGTGLNRVLLGLCTGSVACGAALKIMLMRYAMDRARTRLNAPVIIALSGNYHGTDIVAQTMRGMWPGLLGKIQIVQVQPNDCAMLRGEFRRYGRRVAGFWAEPIMMNREAILLDANFLGLARDLCTKHGALMALDEIQTGFWYPEVFYFRRLGVVPDLLVVGKGMTAGFHPLSALIFREELDILEQYDAISTNGLASLAALIALGNISLIEQQRQQLARLTTRHQRGLETLAREFPQIIERVNGSGFLTGLKFRRREDALGMHQAALGRGLWLRVHAYHEGHRTVLMKYALVVDEAVVDWVLEAIRDLLRSTPWRRGGTGKSVAL